MHTQAGRRSLAEGCCGDMCLWYGVYGRRSLKIYNLNYFMHKFSKIAKLPHGELML